MGSESRVLRLNGRKVVLEADPSLPTQVDVERIPVPSKRSHSFDDLPELFGEYGSH